MTFEYLQRVQVESEIDVPDIGHCAILARNDLGEEWYFATRCELGYVSIFEFGPRIPDFNLPPSSVVISFERFEYSDYKIEKRIDKFLNNSKRMITQAELINLEKVAEAAVNPIEYLLTIEEFSK